MFTGNDHVLDHVDDYLHEALSSEDAGYVERHCEACRICKVALEEARKRASAYDAVPANEASEELIQMTLKRIDQHEKSWWRYTRYALPSALVAAAACLLVLAGVHIHYLRMAPSPWDIKLIGQQELLAGTRGAFRVQVLNRLTQVALANVPVELSLHDRTANNTIKLASFTTDAQGTGQPRFDLPDWADGAYELRVVARPGGAEETLRETIKLKRSWRLMLSSDKPVYQPGQTILVRALALRRPDLKPVAGKEAVFSITDPKGNVVFKRQDLTSKFGITSLECPLATELIEGPYTVACRLGDTESKLTVEVKKYVLPKFKINIELDQPYYQPGQKAEAKVQADYFFGKPVSEGKLQVELRTADITRQPFQRISANLDKDGRATFSFKVPDKLVGRPQASGDAEISLAATVTDSADQQQTRIVQRAVTTNPIRIEVITESGDLVQGVPNQLYLYTSYPDGRPAKTRVQVSGQEKELTTSELGVASLTLAPESEEEGLTIKATDDKGLIGRKHVTLRWGQVAQDFVVRPDRAVYNSGETIKVNALAGGKEPIFLDFIKDGQTMLTETLNIADGKKEFQFDLPPDLFGTLEMVAYRYQGQESLPVRKLRVLYIRPSNQLTIKAGLDHKEYRPGHTAKLKLNLLDSQGKPTPGALSLAAVDEAVYSVLEQAPGMERTFYLLEQQLLKPVYAIYPWSPDLASSEIPQGQRIQFENALFARTANQVAQGNVGTQSRTSTRSRNARIDGRTVPEMITVIEPPSPHTLFVSSFPSKAQVVEAARKAGLMWVETAWKVLGGMLVTGVAGVALFFIGWWIVTSGVVVIAVAILLIIMVGITAMQTLGTNARTTFAEVGAALPAGADMARFALKSEAMAPKSAAPPAPMAMPSDAALVKAQSATASAEPPRVREYFPETLLWRPEVITNEQGEATLDIELADSITTWRLAASAVTADGRLGGLQDGIRVFQPFFVDLNLPVALTRGDEVAVPVVVYNYLSKPQTVELTWTDAPWFERLEEGNKKLELAAGEVRSTSFRLRVRQVGNHVLQVMARGSGVADALKKSIEVIPDGQRIERVINGTLQQPLQTTLTVPNEAIEGSAKAFVKLYPSTFSQLVEGLDNIFRMPSGCFEQTSSTTYPNVLAIDYLRRIGKSVPEVEAKAKQFIHLGYQRLLTFEIAGGGFDWFGRPPANRRLTAYGLMEFEDMAKVHDVDPNLVKRTRDWLLHQRNKDGTWTESPGPHMEADPTRGLGQDLARYSMTAYVAWAVYANHADDPGRQISKDYLLTRQPGDIPDPYLLALTCNALLAMGAESEARPYLDQLEATKRTSEDGKRSWWEMAPRQRTGFFAGGQSANIEATALAVLAYTRAGTFPNTTRAALTWLTEQKDGHGTWHSTQATVLALKALLAGTGKALNQEKERRIEITCGSFKQEIVIPVDQAEVMQQLDLSPHLRPGAQQVSVTDRSDQGTGYQVAFRYHVPEKDEVKKQAPLAIEVVYDRNELKVGDLVKARATIVNQMQETAPMVILDLPIPAGFAIQSEDLARLQREGKIAKFQTTARQATVYLRALQPGASLTLDYSLQATMPVKVSVPPAQAYEYYDPAKRGQGAARQMTVIGA